jgi:GNAT superfamily N-acetyltransferase
MAAVKSLESVTVRAAKQGEGRAIASLWRELWDAHEGWGGYVGTRDQRVYDGLAQRLEEDARVRGGYPVLGRHIHLVATVHGEVAGQVEGWFERHGIDESTPYTCEVRSLIVRRDARTHGVGRALLDELASIAKQLGRGAPTLLAAEVLEPNPAHSFYARVGYTPISWNARVMSDISTPMPTQAGAVARVAEPNDALAISMLEGALAERRRGAGDLRFDRPRAVDATVIGAIAAHLSRAAAAGEASELVSIDADGMLRASCTLAVASLDPPFIPAKRALLGRFAIDPARDPARCVVPLVRLAARLAAYRGAATVELNDLTAPGTPLYRATLAAGARPWSRVVARFA